MLNVKFRKVFGWLVGFLAASLGVLVFVVTLYLLEGLHVAGQPTFEYINTHGFIGLNLGQVVIVLAVIAVVASLVVVLQFLKSLFDKTVKKYCDTAAEELFEKFIRWIEK